MRALDLDLIVVAAFPQILKREILQAARLGAINYHPSMLPQYAGPQPVFWAVRNGERETGMTVHFMTEGIDDGAIISQAAEPIMPSEAASSILRRQHHFGAYLLADAIDKLAAGTARAVPQDPAHRTYFGKRRPSDVEIHWSRPATEILNLLRAVQDWEPLEVFWRKRKLRLYRARLVPGHPASAPGTILRKRPGGFVVQTGEGALEVLDYDIGTGKGWVNRFLRIFVPKAGTSFPL